MSSRGAASPGLARFKHDSGTTAKFHQYYREHRSELEAAHSRPLPLGQAAVALPGLKKVRQAGSAVFVPSLFGAADVFAKPREEACVSEPSEGNQCIDGASPATSAIASIATSADTAAKAFHAPEEIVHIPGVTQQASAQHQEAEQEEQEHEHEHEPVQQLLPGQVDSNSDKQSCKVSFPVELTSETEVIEFYHRFPDALPANAQQMVVILNNLQKRE